MQQGGSRHEPAIHAIAALGDLLLDNRALQGMGTLWRTQALQGRDGLIGNCGDGQHARARGHTIEVNSARTTLSQATPEFGVIETELIAKCVEQRHLRVAINFDVLTIDFEGCGGHVSG